MTRQAVEQEIARLQEIQRRNHPRSAEWQDASKKLQPLFAIMQGRGGLAPLAAHAG